MVSEIIAMAKKMIPDLPRVTERIDQGNPDYD
jgi:hypothetical protein